MHRRPGRNFGEPWRPSPTADAEATLPSGFEESVVLGGLDQPTNVEFSEDGRVFVAEKSGLIKVYDDLSDKQPTIFADLRTKVHNYWDRGLLGLSLDPDFPAKPYVYVLYTHDAPIQGTAPRWGAPGATSDPCPTPPGPTTDGCVVSGHLSRLTADAATNTMTGSEKVLIEDWCQQYPSHSVGDLAFGTDGKLYVSGGDGAAHFGADYGQSGGSLQDSPTPRNPCGDPPTGVGGSQTPPTAEGGALAQSGPAHQRRPGRPERCAPAGRPCNRRRSAGKPLLRHRRDKRQPHHRLRAPQPLPLRHKTGHERGLDRQRWIQRVG